MTPQLGATTRIFLLLGDPVAHSLSPLFQNAAMNERGIDAIYAALRCDAAAVAPLMRALCRAGGGGNVTTPHKASAAAAVEHPTAIVLRTGACNTFWSADGVICGDNTDVHGFTVAAGRLLPTLQGASVLVLGAGGAAAAAVAAVIDEGAHSVHILNRSRQRAADLARRLDPDSAVVRVSAAADQLKSHDFDLVVNATALGLREDDRLPFDLACTGSVRAVLDMTYAQHHVSPFIRHARGLGIAAADGREMLLAQGAAAFNRWFGGPVPVDVMRRTLDDARLGA